MSRFRNMLIAWSRARRRAMIFLRGPWAFSLVLFTLNAYICHELFSAAAIGNLDSNEGVFVSIARFFRDHFTDQRWYPWFNAGMPIENAYQPLLPVLTALSSALTGWP